MSAKTAMGLSFLRAQLVLCRFDHLRGQPSGWILGFDDRELSATGCDWRSGVWVLKQEPQAVGNEIFQGATLKSRTGLCLAKEFVWQFDSGPHVSIFAHSCFAASLFLSPTFTFPRRP